MEPSKVQGSKSEAQDSVFGVQPDSRSPFKTIARSAVKKILTLVLAGLILGGGYNWAVPRFYHEEQIAGFWLGTLHGALMPAALPTLLWGDNVPIFASRNSGRGYKLGYIAGINLCGLLFFGLAFRRPRRPGH
jgi:hypothetical protein